LPQADALAAANSTVYRKMASPSRRNRSKSPEQQQQQTHQQFLERNNNIMLMNLRSPLATVDWRPSTAPGRTDHLDVAAESDAAAAAAAAAAAVDGDADFELLMEGAAAARTRSNCFSPPSAPAALGSMRALTVKVTVLHSDLNKQQETVSQEQADAAVAVETCAEAEAKPSPTLCKGHMPFFPPFDAAILARLSMSL
jgi:hypothetical protein